MRLVYIHRIEERRMKRMEERRKLEPNWCDEKGIDFVHGFDKVIIEDRESIKSGSEICKWFVWSSSMCML